MSLPQFIPLPEAAKKLGLSLADLQARVEAGTIMAGMLPTGEIVVSENELISPKNAPPGEDINAQLRTIKREKFEHLRRGKLTIAEAEKKYKVSGWTIRNWIDRNYISTDTSKYPMKLNEADIAYCVAVRSARKKIGVRSGAPLLDDDGQPYLLKHPILSRYRRERRLIKK
ncbi:MAG: hypothetical protein GY792_23635 [Gammaproteobacteria bacterium]|nr:hypothetical protein [Gammaproteobacteria bacterium]